MKLYLSIVSCSIITLYASHTPVFTPLPQPSAFQPISKTDAQTYQQNEEQQIKARAKKLKKLMRADPQYAQRLEKILKDTVAFITRYQLFESKFQESPHGSLQETILEYIDTQHPNLTLAEAEYILKKSEPELEQHIRKSIGKDKVVKFHKEISLQSPPTTPGSQKKIPESSKLLRKAIMTSANS